MSKVKTFYDRNPFPGNYSVKNFLTQQKHRDNKYINFIVDQTKGRKTLLDIGCGTGYISNFLAYTNKDIKITGVDFSNGVAIAKKISDKLGNKNIKWMQKDFIEMEKSKKYDVILCQGVLHHMPDYKLAVTKIKSLLKPNGIILLGVYNKWVKLLQKIAPLSFFESKILKKDQMECPFEIGFDHKDVQDMFDDYKVTASYPIISKIFPNFHLVWKANSGGLTTYKLKRRKYV